MSYYVDVFLRTKKPSEKPIAKTLSQWCVGNPTKLINVMLSNKNVHDVEVYHVYRFISLAFGRI